MYIDESDGLLREPILLLNLSERKVNVMANLMNFFEKNFSSFRTMTQIQRDAKEIKTTLMTTYQNTSVRASELKRNNKYIRSVFEWFGKHDDDVDDHSSLMQDNDDEFDAGFHYMDDDTQSSDVMTADDMKTISSETTREMFKIGRKRIETEIQFTSEIMTTIDDRSSEILASIRTFDTGITAISKKLDLIITGMTTGFNKKHQDFSYKGTLQDSSGRLTLPGVKEFAQRNAEHVTKTLIQSLMDMTGLTTLDKELNELIQSYQHNLLENIINIPFIKRNFYTGKTRSDYELQIDNRYSKEPAIFDGMTRKSIISIIPDYLRQITQAITGIRLNITKHGSLSTAEIKENFTKSIDVTFDTSSFNTRRLDTFISETTKNDNTVDSADLREVLKLMVEQYVGQMYLHSTKNHFTEKQLENGGDKALHKHIAKLLKRAKGKTLEYWTKLIEIHSTKFITDKNYRSDFAAAVNKSINALDAAAVRNLKESRKVTSTQFTQEMFDDRALQRLRYDSSKFEHEGKTLRQLIREGVISIESLTEKERHNLDKPITTFEDLNDRLETSATEVTGNFLNESQTTKLNLVKDIFDKLNDVVNVFFLSEGPFGPMELRQREQQTQTDQPKQNRVKTIRIKARKKTQQPTKQTYQSPEIDIEQQKQTYESPSISIQEEEQNIPPTLTEMDDTPYIAPKEEPTSVLTDLDYHPIQKQEDADEQKASEVTSILSASKGNTGVANLVNEQIASIKNMNLQQRLKTIVTSSIDRSGKKDSSKSPLGKGLLFVFGLAKSFMSKIFTGIKTFMSNAVQFVLKMLKSSFDKMKTGASAVKEGTKDLIGTLKERSAEKKAEKEKQKEEKRMNQLKDSLVDLDEQPKETIFEKISKTVTNIKNKVTSTVTEAKEKVTESKPVKALQSVGNKLKDKFKNSEFGQGMLSAFDKTKGSKIVATSLFDTTTNGIEEILTSSSSSLMTSVFTSILKAFDKVHEQAVSFIDAWNGMTEDEIKEKQDKQRAEKEKEEKKKQEEEKKKEEEQKSQKKKHGASFAVGKMVGGILNILSGLLQSVMTIVMSMTGLKKITSLIHTTLKNILKPLNKAFNSIYKAIKPVMKSIQNALRTIVDSIVQIFESVVIIIQPILEIIGPILEQMMEALKPILELVTGLVNILVVPLVASIQTVLVPVVQTIGNNVEILFGIIQVGMGLILTATGGILIGVGAIGKIFGAGSLYDTGAKVMSLGRDMTSAGAERVVSGFSKQVALIGSMMTGELARTQEEPEQQETRQERTVATLNGSPMDGIYGSGDANAPYKFDDNVQDALSTLRSLASGIISLFTGESDTETQFENAKDQEAYAKAQMDTADLSDEERKRVDDKAFEMFKSSTTNEQLYGETDEEYRARYEKNKEKYWAKAAVEILHERIKAVADGSDEGAVAMTNSALGLNEDDKFTKALLAYDESAEQGSAVEAMADFVNAVSYSDEDEYYDDDEWEYEYEGGGTGDIFQAASEVFTVARKTAGTDLRWNGTSVFNLKFPDGMVIDKISPTHCTSMMTAIVKRMGYYVPGNQSYSDTYQGTDQLLGTSGGHGSMTWGLQSSDGHPNIYDKDGNVSEDWITGVGNPQPGDITFAGIGGNIHAHMGAYQGANGYWFGFNGGRDDSLKNSVRLGEYYLQHGSMPPSTTVGYQSEGNRYDQQTGALAYPMQYWVRYVGPKSKGGGKRRRVRKKSSSGRSSGGLGIGGSKEDWIKTVAMVFEGYMKSGQRSYDGIHKYYDASHVHEHVRLRNGQEISLRPDCSGTLGAAMTAFGYTLDGAPSGSHYDVTGTNGNLNFIHDPDGSISKDWQLLQFNGHNLEPGDITGNKHHASFVVTNLDAAYPGGLDAGGDTNLVESAKAAEEYLDGKSNPSWRSAMGSGVFSGGMGAKTIVRYVGGGSGKSSSSKRKSTSSVMSTRSTSSSSKSKSKIKTTSNRRITKTNSKGKKVSGKEALIQSAAEIFEAYQITCPALTYSYSSLSAPITTRSGHTRRIRPDCTGTLTAAIQELGYTIRDTNGNDVGDWGVSSIVLGNQSKNTLIYDSPTAKTPSKDWQVLDFDKNKVQRGDITVVPNSGRGQNDGHATMPIVDLKGSPRGFDGGSGLKQSPAAAVAYLQGKPDSQIPWVSNAGYSRMKKIWRYKGTTSVSSANSINRNKQQAKTKSTAARSPKTTTTTSKGNNKVLRAASETFLAALKAQQRDNGPYGHGAILKNVKFDDGMVIDNMSAMCTGTQAAIIKRMGYYLPKDGGKSYSSTYQGNMYMGWANGTPGGWGINNADGRPNIYTKNGQKSKDWIVSKDGSYQAGDISLPSSADGCTNQTMWHAHMAAFKYGGKWYGFNGGDPKNNPESTKGQNIARYYLEHGKMPDDNSGININEYNSLGGNQGIVIRYVGSNNTTSSTKSTSKKKTASKKKASTKKRTSSKKRTTSSSKTSSKNLRGSSNAEKIWNYLTGKGLTEAGAAGLMGNLQAESALIPNNLEDSRQGKLGSDEVYTSRVDSGAYKNFTTDSAGYGLAQWTVSDRKGPLLDYKKQRGTSIGDMGMQLDFLNSELQQKFPGILSTLKSTNSVNTASDKVLREFERPRVLNYDARRSNARQFMNQFGSGDADYIDGVFDVQYNEQPLTDFMLDPNMFGGYGTSDFITPNQFEDIPYTEPTGPMIIPDLPDIEDDELSTQTTIVNQYKYQSGLTTLSQFVDEFLSNDYDVQSTEIRNLVDQIAEEFPEYIMDYFDEDDDGYEFTEEDDALIRQLAAAYL